MTYDEAIAAVEAGNAAAYNAWTGIKYIALSTSPHSTIAVYNWDTSFLENYVASDADKAATSWYDGPDKPPHQP